MKKPPGRPKPRKQALSPKRQRFVVEYTKDHNGTKAAQRAGYSPKNANPQAARLLSKASIRAALVKREAKLLSAADVNDARILQEAARIAFTDRRGFFTEDGNLRPMHDLTPDEAACIDGFEVIIKNAVAGDGEQDIVHKYKLAGKVAAIELLMRHRRLLEPDTLVAIQPVPCFILPPGSRIAIE